MYVLWVTFDGFKLVVLSVIQFATFFSVVVIHHIVIFQFVYLLSSYVR